MKFHLFIIALILNALATHSQITFLIKDKSGKYFTGEYIKKNHDSLTIRSGKDELTLSYNEIEKVQTMGVHFIQDGYTKDLAFGIKALEYDEFGTYKDWKVFISVRQLDSTLVILFKFKCFTGEAPSEWPVLDESDSLICQLYNGSKEVLKFSNTYMQISALFYNFGCIYLSCDDIKFLRSSPIESIEFKGRLIKITDELVVMRQIFAILDEGMLWR